MKKCDHCGARIIEPGETVIEEWFDEPFVVIGTYGHAVHELDRAFKDVLHNLFGRLYPVLDWLVGNMSKCDD